MKIYYDNIIFHLQRAGGISVYWQELIKRLLRDNEDITFIEQGKCENIFRKEIEIKKEEILLEDKIPLKILRYLPIMTKLPSGSIFHSSYYRICHQKDVKNVVTVHDFTYEYFMKGLKQYIHCWQKGRAIKKADSIICVSENTKKDLIRFYPKTSKEKIKVIYNGVSEDFYPIKIHEGELYKKYVDEKFILFVGDRSEYKNFNLTIDVINNLEEYKLVIVGGKPLSREERVYLERKIKGRYEQIRGISNGELNVLYNLAFCLLYPSKYEGFGIPVIEAMKAGCPVIAQDISSIPEIGGNAVIMFKNNNIQQIKESILALEDTSVYQKIVEQGYIQGKKFSWDRAYKETIRMYEAISEE